MRTLAQFLDTLRQETSIDADEEARYAALWPAAAQAADQLEHNMPKVPRFLPRPRRRVFVQLCEQIDALQADNTLDDEQAQLVLTLLRSRQPGYCRAEISFIAWANSANKQAIASAPLTARQLLMGIHYHRQQR